MSTTPQKNALKRYRRRLHQRGMARFEVLGLDADRELIRSLAKRLAGEDSDSARIRATVRRTISGKQPKMGGILKMRIRVVGRAYRYWIEAFSDLSAAVDPAMAIQIYFGGQPTSAIHEEDWTPMRYGWKATGVRSR